MRAEGVPGGVLPVRDGRDLQRAAIVNHFVTSASPFGVEARTLGGHWESCGAARFRTNPLVPSPYFEEDGNEVCDCLDRAAWRLGERK